MAQSALPAPPVAKPAQWTARVLGTLLVLFLSFDVFGKFAMPQPVVDAFNRQGMPLSDASLIGGLLLTLVILYVIPATRVLGVVLLTGYLGGAVCANLRAGFSPFEVCFPIIMGVLVWTPVYLTDERVRALVPLRRPE